LLKCRDQLSHLRELNSIKTGKMALQDSTLMDSNIMKLKIYST